MTDQPKPTEARTGTLDATPISASALSSPDVARYHAVSDRDIDRLKNIEKPWSLIFAAMFAGLVFAGAWPVYSALEAAYLGTAALSFNEGVMVMAWAASLGIAVAAGFASARARSRVIVTLEEIRRRPTLPVTGAVEAMTAAPAAGAVARSAGSVRRRSVKRFGSRKRGVVSDM